MVKKQKGSGEPYPDAGESGSPMEPDWEDVGEKGLDTALEIGEMFLGAGMRKAQDKKQRGGMLSGAMLHYMAQEQNYMYNHHTGAYANQSGSSLHPKERREELLKKDYHLKHRTFESDLTPSDGAFHGEEPSTDNTAIFAPYYKPVYQNPELPKNAHLSALLKHNKLLAKEIPIGAKHIEKFNSQNPEADAKKLHRDNIKAKLKTTESMGIVDGNKIAQELKNQRFIDAGFIKYK